ncbi:MFS transporter [Caldiplasma sukawensis]
MKKITGLRALTGTSLAHFSNDGVFLLFSFLIPYFTKSFFGLSQSVLEIIAAFYILLSGLLSLPLGSYSDRSDRDPELMSLGILILGISVLFFAFGFLFAAKININERYLFVISGAITLGLGQAFYHPLGASILRYSLKNKDSSFYLGLNGSMGSVGRAVVLFITGALVIFLGVSQGLLILALYYFIITLIIYLITRTERKDYISKNEKVKAIKISSFSGVIPFLFILTLTMFLRSAFQLAISINIFTYLNDVFKNNLYSLIFVSVSLATPILGQPLFGHLTKKYGGNIMILSAGIISAVSFLPFILFRNFYIDLVFFAIYAFAAFTGFPSLLGFIGQKIPKETATRANTWVWGIGNTVGGAAGIVIYDTLISYYSKNISSVFLVLYILMILSVITNVFIGRIANRLPSQISEQ